jgi:O-antigen/teichoic acid export membrane protein
VRVGRLSSATGKGLADDDSPPALLRFSAWLTLSSLLIYIVGLAPRVAFARSAYSDVALVDLALLIYTLPQRFVASFVTALIPLASRDDLEEAFPLPGAADLAIAALIGIAAASILWWTSLPTRILVLIGLPAYARAGSLFSIMAAAAPAELVYAYLGGLFQARGESRALAGATAIGVAVSVPLILLASLSGVTAVAVAFAASYWGLALTLRVQYPRSLERETEIARWTISRLRTRGVTA